MKKDWFIGAQVIVTVIALVFCLENTDVLVALLVTPTAIIAGEFIFELVSKRLGKVKDK